MRIKDKIALKVIEVLEEANLKIPKAKYLEIECLIADTIDQEITHWIRYDIDLGGVEE